MANFIVNFKKDTLPAEDWMFGFLVVASMMAFVIVAMDRTNGKIKNVKINAYSLKLMANLFFSFLI